MELHHSISPEPLYQTVSERLTMAPGKIVDDADLGFEYVEWDVDAWAEECLENNPCVESTRELQNLGNFRSADRPTTGGTGAEVLDGPGVANLDEFLSPGADIAHTGLLEGPGPIGIPTTPNFLWNFALNDVQDAEACAFATNPTACPNKGGTLVGQEVTGYNQFQVSVGSPVRATSLVEHHRPEMPVGHKIAHVNTLGDFDRNGGDAGSLAEAWPTERPSTPPFLASEPARLTLAPKHRPSTPKKTSKGVQKPYPMSAELAQRAKNRQGQKPGWPQAKKFHDRRCGGGIHDPGCRIMDPRFTEDVQRLERNGTLWKE